jgi:hypothetical protein
MRDIEVGRRIKDLMEMVIFEDAGCILNDSYYGPMTGSLNMMMKIKAP